MLPVFTVDVFMGKYLNWSRIRIRIRTEYKNKFRSGATTLHYPISKSYLYHHSRLTRATRSTRGDLVRE
jgi:hypothetical protein